MAWAALLKSAGSKAAMQSGKKMAMDVAKEAAVNKVKSIVKKKKVKGKDIAQKMLGGGGKSSGGGALVVRPSTAIVSSPAGGLVPFTKEDEGGSSDVSNEAKDLGLKSFMESLIGVKESVQSIKDSLNDNAEDVEKRLEKQRLLNAKLDKQEQEEGLEKKKSGLGIGKKLLSPIEKLGKSFLQKLKTFFTNMLLGVLINGIMGGHRDVVVTFLLGYRQYRKAKEAATKFILKIGSKIKGGLKGAASKLASSGKNIFKTLVTVGNKLKAWVKKGIEIVIKGVKEGAKRTPQAIRTGQRILQKVKPIQRIKDAGSALNKLRKTPIRETIKGIQSSQIGQRVGGAINRGKNVFNKVKNFKVNWKNVGTGIKDFGIKTFQTAKQSGAGQFIGKQANRLRAFATKNITAMQDAANGLIAGGVEKYKAWRKNIEMMMDLLGNPTKLFEKAKGFLSGKMDKVMKNNKMWQQLKNLKPKNAVAGIGNMLKNLKNSKEVMGVVNTLKNAKKTMKIPMLDRILALILGVVDYTLLGESPINAFGKALGGLLGFSFGTALGSPLGPGAFLVGIAGGIVGEQLANVLSAGLSKVPVPKFGTLGQVPDPIAAATPGMGPRPIVRNPYGKEAEAFNKAQEELSMANFAEGKSSASGTADQISQSASYEDGGEEPTVVIAGGGGEQEPAPESQGGKVKFIPLNEGSDDTLNTLSHASLYKT